jgi:uncharacterized protein (TIGR00730 family)
MIKSVCVFCGSSSSHVKKNSFNKEHAIIAKTIGRELSKRKIKIIYGGANVGLMGLMSDEALKNKGKVIGIALKSFKKWGILHKKLTKTFLVNTLQRRKELMYKKSDAFIVLPGGIGTIDEVFDVIATNILTKSNKLLILLNYKNFWKKLIELLNTNIKQKYSKKEIKNNIKITTSMNEIFAILDKEKF